jgi:hypothetical protein
MNEVLGEVLGELQGPTAIYTEGSKTEGLVVIGIFLDDRDSYRCRLPRCVLIGKYIILRESLASIEGLKSTRIS